MSNQKCRSKGDRAVATKRERSDGTGDRLGSVVGVGMVDSAVGRDRICCFEIEWSVNNMAGYLVDDSVLDFLLWISEETGAEIPVSMRVDGMVVTGTLIPRLVYFQSLSHRFVPASEKASAKLESAAEWDKEYGNFLYLKDAVSRSENLAMAGSQPEGFLRVRIDKIDLLCLLDCNDSEVTEIS